MVVLQTRLLFLLGPRVPWVEPLAIILVSALPTGQVETPWTEFDVVVHEWRCMTVVTVHLLASSGKTKNVIRAGSLIARCTLDLRTASPSRPIKRLSEFIGVHQPFSCNSSRGILSRVIAGVGRMQLCNSRSRALLLSLPLPTSLTSVHFVALIHLCPAGDAVDGIHVQDAISFEVAMPPASGLTAACHGTGSTRSKEREEKTDEEEER